MQTYMFSSAPDKLESVAALFVSTAQLAIGAGALVGGLAVDHFGVDSALMIGGGAAFVTAVTVAASARRR
jgi:predicted MFS family arabinose efflux permease